MSELQAWRKRQKPKVSQAKLAEMLSTKQPHVSEIENNEDRIDFDLAARIFAVTGLRIGKLKKATPSQAKAIAEMALKGAA